MSLPARPPHPGSWGEMAAPIKLGDTGWRAYSVQCMVAVSPDGVFGPKTDAAVKAWQKDHGLKVDGVVGPTSQTTMLELAGLRADRAQGMPEGVGYGFAVSEGANMLAATNWQVPGGVDCGSAQWRVYGPPYDVSALRFAFNARTALDGAVGRLKKARQDFMARNRHLKAEPRNALSVAVLQHNWPSGADSIVRRYPGGGGWWNYVPNPNSPATWVQGHTRSSWAREYPARVLRFVAGP